MTSWICFGGKPKGQTTSSSSITATATWMQSDGIPKTVSFNKHPVKMQKECYQWHFFICALYTSGIIENLVKTGWEKKHAFIFCCCSVIICCYLDLFFVNKACSRMSVTLSYLRLFFKVVSRCLFRIKFCKSKRALILDVISQLSKTQLRVLLLLNLTNIWAFIATQKYYANKSQQHLFFWGSCPHLKLISLWSPMFFSHLLRQFSLFLGLPYSIKV